MSKYVTRQRKVLLEFLSLRADRRLSAQEIADALKDEGVSQSAVYRNLTELEAEGAVRRGTLSTREAYYQYVGADACRSSLHLSCKKCGRTFHMNAGGTAALLSAVDKAEGFAVDKTDTVLYGLCELCRD